MIILGTVPFKKSLLLLVLLGLCKSYLVKKVIPLCKVKEDNKMIEPSELTEHEQCTSIHTH